MNADNDDGFVADEPHQDDFKRFNVPAFTSAFIRVHPRLNNFLKSVFHRRLKPFFFGDVIPDPTHVRLQ